MSQNPFNLGLRFVLEFALLVALSFWGWARHAGFLRYLLVIGLPLVAGLLWALFRVPQDASANGEAPVPVPGWLRLVLELALFGFAIWCLFDAGARTAGWILGGLSLAHYILSYDRIAWLLGTGDVKS